MQFQRRALAPGDHPGQAGFRLPGMPGRPRAIGLRAIDSDHYRLPAPGTGEDVIKQVGDAISSWPATHE
ncbi:MAG TPA: hypothetical protein VII22_21735 [Streptosporangiaceae bacterium]